MLPVSECVTLYYLKYTDCKHVYNTMYCSDVTYATHLESINLLLTILSIQLFQNQLSPRLQLCQRVMTGKWYDLIADVSLFSFFSNSKLD